MVRAVFEIDVFGMIAVTNAVLPLARRSSAPRVVNVSSAAGSLAINSLPDGPLAGLPTSVAYPPSTSVLDALTVQYADELREDGILVNAADPGSPDTDLDDHTRYLSRARSAAVVVRLAALRADGPTGGFFSQNGPVPAVAVRRVGRPPGRLDLSPDARVKREPGAPGGGGSPTRWR